MTVEGMVFAPVPTSDVDNVDISKGDADRLVDYANHIALFKQGGTEFQASLQLYQNFLNAAKVEGLRGKLNGIFRDRMGADLTEREQPTIVGIK